MLEELKKPPSASARTTNEPVEKLTDRSPNARYEKTVSESIEKSLKSLKVVEKSPSEKTEERVDRPAGFMADKVNSNTLERRLHSPAKADSKGDGADALIAQLNSRVSSSNVTNKYLSSLRV